MMYEIFSGNNYLNSFFFLPSLHHIIHSLGNYYDLWFFENSSNLGKSAQRFKRVFPLFVLIVCRSRNDAFIPRSLKIGTKSSRRRHAFSAGSRSKAFWCRWMTFGDKKNVQKLSRLFRLRKYLRLKHSKRLWNHFSYFFNFSYRIHKRNSRK